MNSRSRMVKRKKYTSMRKVMKYITSVNAVLLVVLLTVVQASSQSSSTNFEINQDSAGPTQIHGTSTNYEFRAEIGAPGVGQSASPGYVFDHGATWLTEHDVFAVYVSIDSVTPEGRVGINNNDTRGFLTVRTGGNILYTSPLFDIQDDGTTAAKVEMVGISAGTFDIGFKGAQHLTRVLQNVPLGSGNNTLNFPNVLKAGDINGDGNSPASLGDDVINAVDLSVLIADLNINDPDGNTFRANLNQDNDVNSVDLSILIANLDEVGET